VTAPGWPAAGDAVERAFGSGVGSARTPRGWPAVRPIAIMRLAVALVFVGNLGRIPVLNAEGKDAPILLNELVLLAVLAASALVCIRARAFRLDGVAIAGLGFAAVGGGSAVFSSFDYGLNAGEVVYSLAYLARWVAYLGLYVAILNVARDDDARALWRTLERMILAFAGFGVFQSVFLPGFAQLVYPERGGDEIGWDHQGHRLVSTFLDPNFAGALVVILLLVHLAQLTFGVRVPRWKPVLLFSAVVLTFSRSSVLALLVGGLVILAARGIDRRLVRLGVGAALLALPFTPLIIRFGLAYNKFSVDESAMLRTIGWLRALTVLADHPVWGVGFNTYGFVQRHYGWRIVARDAFGLDGGLLFIAVMTGLVGLAVYVAMLALGVRRCRRLWRDAGADPVARGIALGTGSAVVALVLHSCFSSSLLFPFLMEPLWVLFGIVFLEARRRRGQRALASAWA
jgi:hypothetical protein